MMDLRGRSVRTSKFTNPAGASYCVGDKVEIRTDGFEIDSSKEEIQINYFDLPPIMREGDLIILGDNGQVHGHVTEISRTSFSIEIK